ncbi:DUF4080 domain-containing protein [Bacillus sp. HMF5848]|uniref:B12-binding domain-containing radical SAM protein n=1 Tax=Bacillus sp. HMF5848 TaxID=2495421 RepID=UPI000F77BA6A|nr:B12-binding domain-containing radical SAM protein [Bacillus sp. HMF5848]RSK26708.1 DUF4080 domain-containing protein [Bacillus sp. HMF5848]
MKVIAATLNAKYIHTNIAIRYLKAYAAPEFDIELAEYTIKDPAMNIVTDLYNRKPDVIGFSCYIWNIRETIQVVSMIKKVLPNVTIVFGGPEVTYDYEDWLQTVSELDFIVIGEGEVTFKELLTALSTNNQMEHISGLAYRRNDTLYVTPQRSKLQLQDMPSPYQFEEDIPHLSKRVSYIETSRGCPFSCQFCLSSIEVGVRYFNREKIKEDIRYLMANGARTIKFVDRTFNISRSYAMEMFEFLINEHVPGTVFQFEITADIMRPEVIEYLNEHAPAGLFRFEIGVQSTNEYTNELVQRKQNWDKLVRTVSLVKNGNKIDQHLDLIAGLPEENYTSFRRTFNDVFALRPEELQLGFLKMLRGTGLRVRANEYGYIFMEQAPYEMLANSVLSFADVVRIKQVEDVLEKYWNDHRMDETIEFIVTHVFETPFDFFQEFGTYWEEQGWGRIGHQLEDLFIRLYTFIRYSKPAMLNAVFALMKIDYLRNQKYKPRKPWWDDTLSKDERSKLYRKITEAPHLLGSEFVKLALSEKDMHKHTIIDTVSVDLQDWYKEADVKEGETIVLAYFDPYDRVTKLFFGNQNLLLV